MIDSIRQTGRECYFISPMVFQYLSGKDRILTPVGDFILSPSGWTLNDGTDKWMIPYGNTTKYFQYEHCFKLAPSVDLSLFRINTEIISEVPEDKFYISSQRLSKWHTRVTPRRNLRNIIHISGKV